MANTENTKTKELPFITVATIAVDRAWVLPYMLKSFLEQDYPKEKLLFLYIDGGSKDGSPDLVKKVLRNKVRYRIILAPRTNIPEARNIALRECMGSYIVFWDSDIVALRKDALRLLIEKAQKHEKAIVQLEPIHVRAESVEEAILKLEKMPKLPTRWKETLHVGMDFTAIPKKAIEEIGFFDEDMVTGEDKEYSLRLRAKGYDAFLMKGVIADIDAKNAPSSDIYAYMPLRFLLRGIRKRAKISVYFKDKRAITRTLLVGQMFFSATLLSLLFPAFWYVWVSQIPIYIVATVIKRGKSEIAIAFRNLLYHTLSFFPLLYYLLVTLLKPPAELKTR